MCFERIGRLGAILSVLPLFFGESCTVKEDRKDCPCLLSVEFSPLPPGPVEYRIEAMDGSLLARETVAQDSVYFLKVPRDGVRLVAISGTALADDVVIPYGSDCPPAYISHATYDTNYEAVQIRPTFNKHFCTLSIILDGPPGNGGPVQIGIRGRVGALSLEGRPLAGEFSYISSGRASPLTCRLPRQAPSEQLLLDIVMEDNLLRTFALGTYLRQSGYDWGEKDLKDVSVTICLSVTHITFHIQDWSVCVERNVEI